MNCIGILYQPQIAAAQALTPEIKTWLASRGIACWISSSRDETAVADNLPHTDLLIVLGGDGSTLHSARMAQPFDVPIFGVNLGRVGFLSEAEPDEWQSKLEKALNGDFWLEKRMMLHAVIMRNGRNIQTFVALNEITVSRDAPVRLVNLRLNIDDEFIAAYQADGLIISTPTGSTGYAMAVGGPILPPQAENFIIMPIAPHLSLDRALTLPADAKIAIHVEAGYATTVTADGHDSAPLQTEDAVIIKKHKNHALFVRVESPGYFYRRLLRRLGVSRTTLKK